MQGTIEADNIKYLLKQLVSECVEEQEKAAEQLRNLACSPDGKSLIIATGFAIPVLLSILEKVPAQTQEDIIGSIWGLTFESSDGQAQVAAGGGIPALAKILEQGSHLPAKEAAAAALANLAANHVENQQIMASSGVLLTLSSLITGLPHNTHTFTLQELMLLALRHITTNPKACAEIMKMDGMRVKGLLNQLSNILKAQPARAGAQEHTAAILLNLKRNPAHHEITSPMVDDVLPELFSYLFYILKQQSSAARVREQAAGALGSLIIYPTHWFDYHELFSVIPRLVKMLSSGLSDVQESSSWALANLALEIPMTKQVIADANALPKLVGLLSSGSIESQKLAATALGSLAMEPKGVGSQVVTAGAVPKLIILLDSASEATQEQAAAALSMLASCIKYNLDKVATWSPAVPKLIALLSSRASGVQGQAAGALSALTNSPDCLEAIKSLLILDPQTTITVIVKLLEDTQPPLVHQMTIVLVNHLLGIPVCASPLVDKGVIPTLLNHIESTLPLVQWKAVDALQGLSNLKNELWTSKLVNAGAIPLLARLLLGTAPQAVKESAMRALFGFLKDRENQIKVGEAGIIKYLIPYLNKGNATSLPDVIEALMELSEIPANTYKIVHEGGVQALVRLLTYISPKAQDHVLETLFHICQNPDLTVKVVDFIPFLIGHLDNASSLFPAAASPKAWPPGLPFPLKAIAFLEYLSKNHHCRHKIDFLPFVKFFKYKTGHPLYTPMQQKLIEDAAKILYHLAEDSETKDKIRAAISQRKILSDTLERLDVNLGVSKVAVDKLLIRLWPDNAL